MLLLLAAFIAAAVCRSRASGSASGARRWCTALRHSGATAVGDAWAGARLPGGQHLPGAGGGLPRRRRRGLRLRAGGGAQLRGGQRRLEPALRARAVLPAHEPKCGVARARAAWARLSARLETSGAVVDVVLRQLPLPFVGVNVAAGASPMPWWHFAGRLGAGAFPRSASTPSSRRRSPTASRGRAEAVLFAPLAAGGGVLVLSLRAVAARGAAARRELPGAGSSATTPDVDPRGAEGERVRGAAGEGPGLVASARGSVAGGEGGGGAWAGTRRRRGCR